MKFKVEISECTEKSLEKIPKKDRLLSQMAIKKLLQDVLIVLVVEIGHRREIYR